MIAATVGVAFTAVVFAVAAGSQNDLHFENAAKLQWHVAVLLIAGTVLILVTHAYALQRLLPDKITVFGMKLLGPNSATGPRKIREETLGKRPILTRFAVSVPVAALLLIALEYMPCHGFICWWLRFVLLADIALLWLLWPAVVAKPIPEAWRELRQAMFWPQVAAMASVALAILVVAVLTFPGEALDNNLLFSWLHEPLVAGDTQRNILVLRGLDAIDHSKFDSEEKIAAIETTVSLRNRDLRKAVLNDAKLRKADFTGAKLEGAHLDRADLREAKFGCDENTRENPNPRNPNPRRASPVEGDCTQLNGAFLSEAQLQGASFKRASLRGATLNSALLQGAFLDSAQLQGSWHTGAQLQGASLIEARLDGASLGSAELQSAKLDGASFVGANLAQAHLEGASLNVADLRSTEFWGAHLEGASLRQTNLKGAETIPQNQWLDPTTFKNPKFEVKFEAQFREAELIGVFVWNTKPPHKEAFEGANVKNLRHANLVFCDKGPLCDWTPDMLKALKDRISDEVPEGELRTAALEKIKRLEAPPLWNLKKRWYVATGDSSEGRGPQQKSAAQWIEAGCLHEGAPYVIRSWLRSLDTRHPMDAAEKLRQAQIAKKFDNAHCAGAIGLSKSEQARIGAMAADDASAVTHSSPPMQ